MKLNYKYIDKGHSQTIMLLHGFLQTHMSMMDIARHLSDLRNIILVDLPGFGGSKSVGLDYQMTDVADALREILDKLDIQEVDVLGYSMGGRTALAFSIEHPERISALFLESASPGIDNREARSERYLIDKKRHDNMLADYHAFIEEWESMPLFKSQKALDPIAFESQRRERLTQDAHEAADSLLKYGTAVQASYWSKLSDIRIPVYLIVGEKDKKFLDIARSMSERINGATLIVMNACGHNVHLEDFKAFMKRLRLFLN